MNGHFSYNSNVKFHGRKREPYDCFIQIKVIIKGTALYLHLEIKR